MRVLHFLVWAVTCYFVFGLEVIRGDQDANTGPPTVETEAGAVIGKIEFLPLGKSAYEILVFRMQYLQSET